MVKNHDLTLQSFDYTQKSELLIPEIKKKRFQANKCITPKGQ